MCPDVVIHKNLSRKFTDLLLLWPSQSGTVRRSPIFDGTCHETDINIQAN